MKFSDAIKEIKYDVIGLSEVKREDEEILETEKFVLCSKTNTRKRGSIGFAVKKKWKIELFKSYSDRVAVLLVKVNDQSFGFVQGYAPTSASKDEEINDFYDQIHRAIKDVEKCKWVVVMGDWNAKIGQCDCDTDVMGRFGFGVRNERGEKLIQFVRSQKLFIVNSMFKKNEKRRATWSLGKANNEIDFLMIRNSQKDLVKDVNVINKLEYESDHKMIRTPMKLDVKEKKIPRQFKPRLFITNDQLKMKEFQKKLQ